MSHSEISAVDIDDESVLSSIFKDKFSESDRKNPDFLLFLSQLSSYGINKLNLEPSRLNDERSRISDLTQELAFYNYKTFIRTAKCSKDIFQDFGVIENRLQNLLEKLPQLSEHGRSFTKEAATIGAIRHSNSLTLRRHTELLEILEIPQLMDTCVRNQYYEDALELMFYVKRLDKKTFIAEIPVMASVIKDVQQSAQLMLEQLLSQLRTSIQLPACLRVVGFLRRLECFTEPELRLRFLQARNSWLESVLSSISIGDSENDAYELITRTIEICRVHLFDIVTQYRAIFSDDTNTFFDDGLSKRVDNQSYDASIFHCWLTYRINCFLQTLQGGFESGVGNRLDSVLGQCMYFGQSFSRVGVDFRCLLIPIFRKAIVTSFTKLIEQATFDFETDMSSYSLLATSVSYNQVSSSGSLSTPSGDNSSLQPPIGLIDFPPLAVYVNGILAAFNQLRLCAPLSMAVDLPPILSLSATRVANNIVAFYNAEEPAFSNSERMSFVRFCTAFTNDALPHIENCFQSLFPSQLITESYGSVNLSLQPTKGFVIDFSEVASLLEPCLPKKQQQELADVQESLKEETLNASTISVDSVASEEKPLHSGSPRVPDVKTDTEM